jgi:hypothetical protein
MSGPPIGATVLASTATVSTAAVPRTNDVMDDKAHTALLARSEHGRHMRAPGFHDVGIGVATACAFGLAATEIFAR